MDNTEKHVDKIQQWMAQTPNLRRVYSPSIWQGIANVAEQERYSERTKIIESIRQDAAKHAIDAKTLSRFGLEQNQELLAEILNIIADAVEDESL